MFRRGLNAISISFHLPTCILITFLWLNLKSQLKLKVTNAERLQVILEVQWTMVIASKT